MNLRKHIIIPEKLFNKVIELNGGNKKNYSKTIVYILEKGIDNLSLNENVSFNNTMLEKVYLRGGYTIDLIEQLFKELDMSKALDDFKKNRYKDSKYVK